MNDFENSCKICGSKVKHLFDALILNKYSSKYFQCSNCGFVQTEDPFWLEESYTTSMNLGDTGQVNRNFINSIKVKFLIHRLLNPKGKYLDFAGGYGLFTRTMRDSGFNFFWEDLYTKNLFAIGFESTTNNLDGFDAITVFECFEHWVNPIEEIDLLFQRTDTIIFSTGLISVPAPLPEEWWYYGLDHGQHVSFFSRAAFSYIEKKFNCRFFSKGGIHVLTKKKISIVGFYFAVIQSKILIKFLEIGNQKSYIISDHYKLISRK